MRLRRSARSEAALAFPFVFWNLGMAIAASIPMITTTINSSISVKPRRLYRDIVVSHGKHLGADPKVRAATCEWQVKGKAMPGPLLSQFRKCQIYNDLHSRRGHARVRPSTLTSRGMAHSAIVRYVMLIP